ncbi:MAG: FxsA family protein [Alphaproteobacteria bacterium]|nr:FxsA family protein [Alphaproteobacteria bacterium]
MPFFVAIFIVVPLVELYVFLQVGESLGIFHTLLICVLTAIIGGFLVKQQGLATLMGAKSDMRTGKMPIGRLFDGFCIVIAGALLLTPGFVTDGIGFALLLPPLRAVLREILMKSGKFHFYTGATRASDARGQSPHSETTIIEGEFEHVEEQKTELDHKGEDR